MLKVQRAAVVPEEYHEEVDEENQSLPTTSEKELWTAAKEAHIPESKPATISDAPSGSKIPTTSPKTGDTVFHHNYESIKNKLNFYYGVKEKSLQTQFQLFHGTKRSIGLYYFFITIVVTLIIFPASLLEFYGDIQAYGNYHSHPRYYQRLVSSAILFVNNIAGILSSWYLFSMHIQVLFPSLANQSVIKYLNDVVHKYIPNFSSIHIKHLLVISIQIFFLGMMAQRSLNLNCVTPMNSYSKLFDAQLCYEGVAMHNVLFGQGVVALSVPFLTSVNIPEVHIGVIWGMCILANIIVLLLCIATKQMDSFPKLAVWSGIMIVSMIDVHIRNVSMFFVNMDLNQALSDVKRIEEENRANELRSMIANVAHDLKTPLASLSTGMEYIALLLSELTSRFISGNTSNSNDGLLTKHIENIHSCLNNMRDTNAFMLMTINRCIDYTKVTKGIKLNPRFESVNIADTLNLPIQCIRNLQERICIKLDRIPSHICQFVFTDKQWLQENVLCLLSNAVKYSNNGDVRIRIQLVHRTEIFKRTRSSLKEVAIDSKLVEEDQTETNPVDDSIHSNSISYSVLAPTSATSSNHANKYILVEVEDSGIGISSEAQKVLFKPFRQAQRLTGGTGLGLFSLAKRMEALNGYYGVQNRIDGCKGSLFWFSFPYRPDPMTAELKSVRSTDSGTSSAITSKRVHDLILEPITSLLPSPKQNSSSMSTLSTSSTALNSSQEKKLSKKLKILIVDDSLAILKMTSMILKKLSFETFTAENGQQALDKIQQLWNDDKEQYDVVLMDLQMPVMDGFEATKRIRMIDNELFQKQFIIGMSANSDHETKQEAILVGMNVFIDKPFNVQQFQDILQKEGLLSIV